MNLENDFYCGSCGKYKKIELIVKRDKLRPMCKSCDEKVKKTIKTSDETRYKKRIYAIKKQNKKGDLTYLIPKDNKDEPTN